MKCTPEPSFTPPPASPCPAPPPRSFSPRLLVCSPARGPPRPGLTRWCSGPACSPPGYSRAVLPACAPPALGAGQLEIGFRVFSALRDRRVWGLGGGGVLFCLGWLAVFCLKLRLRLHPSPGTSRCALQSGGQTDRSLRLVRLIPGVLGPLPSPGNLLTQHTYTPANCGGLRKLFLEGTLQTVLAQLPYSID